MKLYFSISFLMLLQLTGAAQQLTVIVTNIKNDKGKIGAALYNSKESFMKNPFMTQGTASKKGEVTLVFGQVPKGEYALSILHDENNNAKMDSNVVGIPKEGFGFSNNAMGIAGPPGWDKSKFEVTGVDQTVTIRLKHM